MSSTLARASMASRTSLWRMARSGQSPVFHLMSTTLDLTGSYLTPGWIDIHVHVYGTLGFADPDSIGVCQGVTSYVEAGGPGIGTLDEFLALLEGRTKTTLYAGPYIRPLGILGLNFIESDVRTLTNIPIADGSISIRRIRACCATSRSARSAATAMGRTRSARDSRKSSTCRFTPISANTSFSRAMSSAYEIYRVSEAGDIVTHVYHGNECGILDKRRQDSAGGAGGQEPGCAVRRRLRWLQFFMARRRARLGAGLFPGHHQLRSPAVQRRRTGVFAGERYDLLHEARHVAAATRSRK